MASNVEVLRDLWSDLSREVADPDRPQALRRRAERQRAALSVVLPVLEAREAQPKVEGRMEETTAALLDRRMETYSKNVNAPFYACDAANILADWRRARSEESRLRELFDTTRHQVLRAMGVDDMGHGWFWVESELASRRASEAALSGRVATLAGLIRRVREWHAGIRESMPQDLWNALIDASPPSKPETP